MLPSKIGPITGYINDFSGVISPEKLSELNQLFQQIESKNLAVKQVVTVIFPHREGIELLDIGLELFNHVGIGEKGVNNGLLLLISSEEKKLRIIVGKGLEFIHTEDWCRDVIENHLRPLLDAEKYEELIVKWKAEIENIGKNNSKDTEKKYYYPKQKAFRDETNIKQFFLTILISPFIGIVFFIISSGIELIITILLGYRINVFGLYLNYVSFIFFGFCFFLYHLLRKNIKFGGTLAIVFIICIIGSITYINNRYIEKRAIYCQSNPEICEQEKIERQRYNSSSHSSDSSSRSSSRSSSSDFGGGGGSTNGAGWGD